MDNLSYSDIEYLENNFDVRDTYICPDKEEAQNFLKLLDPRATYFTFQTLNDNKKTKSFNLTRLFHGTLDEHWDELVELNGKGAGIFLTVNKTDGNGRTEKNIIAVRAIFQDDDDGYEGTYPLTPSIQVQTSPGKFQRYWLSSDVSVEQFKDLQERLIESYGCDKNVNDLPRVLRLPGFFHRKNPEEPYLVRLVDPCPGSVYEAEQLKRAFRRKTDLLKLLCGDSDAAEVASDDKVVHLKSPPAKSLDAEGEEGRILSALAALPRSFVDERNSWRDIGMALHSSGLPNARDIFDEWSKNSSKYDEAGQEALWNSLAKSYNGAKITIKTLFYHASQNGWIDQKRNYHHTDLGNAQRLVDRHGINLRFVVEPKKWLIWRDGRWNVDNSYEIERLAKETVGGMWAEADKLGSDDKSELRKHAFRSESSGSFSAMITVARSEEGIPISTSHLDADPNLLGVQNGVIDLRTDEFREARREDYITKGCGTHYDPEAKCPNWLKFLDRIMGGNQDIIAYLQRFDGYGLTGSVAEEVFRILWGTGKNGKSTYRETKSTLLGDYSDACGVDALMQKRDAGAATPQVAKLKGLRHVSINETKENGRLSEERIKNLTSNESMEARFLHQNCFTFPPTHKIDITTNHKPIITGTDEGIWRRIHLVPFTVTIPEEERDENYREKYLMPELPGILNWMLKGLKMYKEIGLRPPEEIKAATRDYRAEMDIIVQWLQYNCLLGRQYEESILDLYEDYAKYVEDEFGRGSIPLSKRKFGDALSERGFEAARTGASRLRKGLMLRESDKK